MKLVCQDCGKSQLVHSGHYWRYRRPSRCDCGGRLLPNKVGMQQIKSRDNSLKNPVFKGFARMKTKIDEQALNEGGGQTDENGGSKNNANRLSGKEPGE